jgi:hypothetical protein
MAYQGHSSIRKHGGNDPSDWLQFTCGHCDTKVSGAVVCGSYSDHPPIKWILCPNCNDGSVFARNGNLYPGVMFGPNIEGIPIEIEEAYDEARECMSINAFTAAELISRKILMHVAVEKGASEGDSFANYITFLEKAGFVTPPMKGWVSEIQKNGNKSTHKLASPSKERAESTVMFTAELLRLIYEMEHMSNKYASKSNKSNS